MGHYETRAILDSILGLIGSEGMSGVVMQTSRATAAIDELMRVTHTRTVLPASRIVSEFRRQELVTFSREPQGIRLQLTVKGIHRLQRAQLELLAIRVPDIWDKKWRMVVFDIPARRAESRYILTSQLKRLGFVMVQRSMWLCPYPCFNEVSQLLVYANLQPFVTLAEISRIDSASEQKLFKQFPRLQ